MYRPPQRWRKPGQAFFRCLQRWRMRDLAVFRCLQQERGFMLIEVIFTLTIIMVLSSVAVLSLKRQMERIMLDQYATQIKADIAFGQSEAIRTHSNCEWRWDRLTPSYQIFINNHLVRSRNPPVFITYKYKYFTFPSNRIDYDYNGRTSISGQIILTNSYGDIRDLVLYMQSGQVRVLNYILQT